MRLRLLSPGLLLLLSLPLFAQNTRESVTVEVVDVPVFVSRGAQPVNGLTRDDFELYVNGKRRAIEYFDVIRTGSGTATTEPLRERRLFLLLFDVAYSDVHALGRAQRAAAEMIARAPASDYFAVGMFSSRRGVWFASPFTRDRTALARAVASLTKPASGDPLSIVVTSRERQALNEWSAKLAERSDPFFRPTEFVAERGAGGRAEADAAETEAMTAHILGDMWLTQVRHAAEEQLVDFTQLARKVGALQGQKHVVLLSSGFDGGGIEKGPSPGQRAANTSFSLGPGGIPDTAQSMDGGVVGGPVMRQMREMHQAFQGKDILLHTLDLKGVSTLLGNDALSALASGTGGKFVHNRNDIGNALVDLATSYSQSYVLGFRATGARPNHNTIEVKLRNAPRGTTVSYRKGFDATPDPVNVREGLYLADVVLNDVPQTGTAPELIVMPGTVAVRLPMKQLAAQVSADAKAELLIYSFAANGTAVGFSRVLVPVSPASSGIETMQFPLAEGVTTVKALLAVNGSLGFSKGSL